MNNINKTLYIPLYGKAYVSRRSIVLKDPKAEAIWAAEGFPLKGKARSKWLAYYMGIRAAVFDRWLEETRNAYPDALILHIGCGMDSRVSRLGTQGQMWYDIDFPEVIAQRRRYFEETETYHMLCADVRDPSWLSSLPCGCPAIVVMEGVSMYLTPEDRAILFSGLTRQFPQLILLADCYTVFAAKASRFKNPINEVGVTQVCGLDDPAELTAGANLPFTAEYPLTPESLIRQLPKQDQRIFRALFAGAFARKLYRLYEFRSQ